MYRKWLLATIVLFVALYLTDWLWIAVIIKGYLSTVPDENNRQDLPATELTMPMQISAV